MATGGGPADTVRVTVLPSSSLVPSGGSWRSTSPAGFGVVVLGDLLDLEALGLELGLHLGPPAGRSAVSTWVGVRVTM